LIGTGISLADPCLAEMAALAGFDIVLIETEHSQLDYQAVAAQIIAAKAGGAFSAVRVPWNEPFLAKRVLEIGPDAVIFPMINTADEAKKAMDACVYPPDGTRGIGPVRAFRYGLTDLKEYVKNSDQALLRIIMVESKTAVKNLPEILKTQFVDAILIGPCDMSFSIGRGGDIKCPENMALIEQTVSACKKSKLPVGIWIGDDTEQELRLWWKKGFDFLLCSNEFVLLSAAQKQLCKTLKAAQR
jgi:2-dehydro-3-deoxyglucarate aldolase/4-hydroxy-2-oxoheptanedioate aldolase